MKMEGPCNHCGTEKSPMWRHGPFEKPMLCNACGTRYRKKGTLDDYFPGQPQRFPVKIKGRQKLKIKNFGNFRKSENNASSSSNKFSAGKNSSSDLETEISSSPGEGPYVEVEEEDGFEVTNEDGCQNPVKPEDTPRPDSPLAASICVSLKGIGNDVAFNNAHYDASRFPNTCDSGTNISNNNNVSSVPLIFQAKPSTLPPRTRSSKRIGNIVKKASWGFHVPTRKRSSRYEHPNATVDKLQKDLAKILKLEDPSDLAESEDGVLLYNVKRMGDPSEIGLGCVLLKE